MADRDGYVACIGYRIAATVLGLRIVKYVLNFDSRVFSVIAKLKNLTLFRIQTAQLEPIPRIIITRIGHIGESL